MVSNGDTGITDLMPTPDGKAEAFESRPRENTIILITCPPWNHWEGVLLFFGESIQKV